MFLETGPNQAFFTNSLHNQTNANGELSPLSIGYVLHQAADVSLAHLVSVSSRYSIELTTHGSRVSYFSAVIAREIGQSAYEIDLVRRAGLLHDIGKILVPWQIYSKPGVLTQDEKEQMQ